MHTLPSPDGQDPRVASYLRRSLVGLPPSALRTGMFVLGAPGSGKSRILGRILCFFALLLGLPVIVWDPTGGTIDNLLSKIMQLGPDLQRMIWPRIRYVDMSGRRGIVRWPLYFRQRPDESLYSISQRFVEIIRRSDPMLVHAPVEGFNAVYRLATFAGMVLAALDLQITEMEDLIRHPERWKSRFNQALAAYPEVAPAVSFFREFAEWRPDLRIRRSDALLIKLMPFLDPAMRAMFGGSYPGISFDEGGARRQGLFLDFRDELDPEHKRFKMLSSFLGLTEYFKQRGAAGRTQPILCIIDEVSQLLGLRTLEHSLLAEDLEELTSVVARNYGVLLAISAQNLTMLEPRIQNALTQLGTQVIGRVSNPDDALYLARALSFYDPAQVRKREPVWMGLSQPALFGSYTVPTIVDYRSVEFTPEEQLLNVAKQLQQLGRFQFLVRAATREGTVAAEYRRMTIASVDRGIYPNEELVAQARQALMDRDASSLEEVSAEIAARTGKSSPKPLRKRTQKGRIDADGTSHSVSSPARAAKEDDIVIWDKKPHADS